MQLLYMGFEQVQNVREYMFHGVEHGQPTLVFVVSTDLALFRRNNVNMQEGPALCLRLLTVELPAAATAAQPLRRTVTDHDMLAYLIARAAPLAKKHALRHA